jgi:hypothetical protein
MGLVSDLDSQGVSGYSEELARTMRILSAKRELYAGDGNPTCTAGRCEQPAARECHNRNEFLGRGATGL